MDALLILLGAVVILELILFSGWIIAAISEPDPFDQEALDAELENLRRGMPTDGSPGIES